MNLEIERKFIVDFNKLSEDSNKQIESIVHITQVYLSLNPEIRIRKKAVGDAPDKYYLTIKGKGTLERTETEVEIDGELGNHLIRVPDEMEMHRYMREPTTNAVLKYRYDVLHNNRHWTVDVFNGMNSPLVMAEIELGEGEIWDDLILPNWIGVEVTEDERFYNKNLAINPFKNWVNDLSHNVTSCLK